jgi:hypothetical protein
MTDKELEQLVRHPEYHGISLGFWHAVDACGLDYIRDLDSDEIANVILKVVRLPKDRMFRKFLVDACRSWLREEHNFWGSLFEDECEALRSGDFTKEDVLSLLQQDREQERVEHDFPMDGILYLRSPLPASVLLEHQHAAPGAFMIDDTQSALGFKKTIMFTPKVGMSFNAELGDGRVMQSALYGFFTILTRDHPAEWRKLIPSLVAQKEIRCFVEDGREVRARML